MKIANIIYDNKLINHEDLDYINYYNSKTEYNSINTLLPTLYVGRRFLKESNPNNEIILQSNVLEKKIIANKLYWECSFDEDKSSNINGVVRFVNLIPKYYFEGNFKYSIIDPVFLTLREDSQLYNALPNNIIKVYKFKDEMIYLLSENNKIFGIDLKMLNYFKFDIEKLDSVIDGKCDNIVNDIDGEIFKKFYRILPDYELLRRYVVSLI